MFSAFRNQVRATHPTSNGPINWGPWNQRSLSRQPETGGSSLAGVLTPPVARFVAPIAGLSLEISS